MFGKIAKPLALTGGLVRAGCWNFWAAGCLAGGLAGYLAGPLGRPNLCLNTVSTLKNAFYGGSGKNLHATDVRTLNPNVLVDLTSVTYYI